jgi:hypothetical protein
MPTYQIVIDQQGTSIKNGLAKNRCGGYGRMMGNERDEYLNIWARQLLREHSSICWQYGLKLSSPVIEIADLSSCWGRWQESPATITIVTGLILNKSWDVVLNVLKHEMAHQLVSEDLVGKPGHGKDFSQACQMLGLPSPFCKASGDLPETSATSSGIKMVATGRILEKIRKLLALGDSANEHESLLAIRKAGQLMERHKLNERSALAEDGCTGVLINLKRKRLESYHRAICSILQEHFQVEIVIVPLYDATKLTSYKNIDIMGRTENVEVAEYVFHFLLDRLSILWQERKHADHCRQRGGKNSYWLGVLNGFREALQQESPLDKVEGKPTNRENRGGSNLPVTGSDHLLSSFVRERHPKLRAGRNRKIRVDNSFFASGVQAGRLLKLRRGIWERKSDQETCRLPLLPARG